MVLLFLSPGRSTQDAAATSEPAVDTDPVRRTFALAVGQGQDRTAAGRWDLDAGTWTLGP
jgi:uncharacterized cupin superfamily protein